MFTGIISDVGKVLHYEQTRITLYSRFDPKTISIGSSIACDGICLSVISVDTEESMALLSFDVSQETRRRTTLGSWAPGRLVNLERSVRAGEELSGHLVSGHVDGVAQIMSRKEEGQNIQFTLKAEAHHVRFIAPKGSVALDGTSLTVNEVNGVSPHSTHVGLNHMVGEERGGLC